MPRFHFVAKVAALGAVIVLSCCVARSDAQLESAAHPSLDTSHIVGSGSVAAVSGTSDIVASAQSMLTTPQTDDVGDSAARVAPRIETTIHARRIESEAPVRVRFSGYLAPGARRTIHAGSPGITWVTERVTTWDGVVVGRQIVSRQVVSEASPSVVLVGSPRTLAQLRAMLPRRALSPAVMMVATAYTADTATAYPTGYTATGILAQQGIVAVDPHVIPLGTTLFIPGYGIGLAADTGGAIIGHRIDLCMDRYGDAVNFGRQTIPVYIIKQ